ncbi:hypothetical protein Hokovirus_1_65 [Hokovirus HKV1]|uniref:Uncharacterized protein n=1 Tax=Hokovirus HKV1 TaxID=1977638 RepID=A0A1V0SEP4_9VIRU|nr:hypothetical protein Hokovirus_1_65 [Hokovirus HKV1]
MAQYGTFAEGEIDIILKNINKKVETLNANSSKITETLESHNESIKLINNHVDQCNNKMEDAQKTSYRVLNKLAESTCYLYICIVVEFLLLLLCFVVFLILLYFLKIALWIN